MEIQHIIGIVLLGISMFCLGYAIAYMQILKKLLQMLEEETKSDAR
jgi:CBS domain containing-hemolysin-like protein